MIGDISGLATAFLWSLSMVLIRRESERIDIFSLNALRLIPSSIMFLILLVVLGRWDRFSAITISDTLFLSASVILSYCIGDTAFFRSMHLLGVSRAVPISNAYPLFTLLLAFVFLGERVTLKSGLGIAIIAVGVTVITLGEHYAPDMVDNEDRHASLKGALLAMFAAFAWAAATAVLRVGVVDIDIIAANAIRLPIASLIMLGLAVRTGKLRVREYGKRSLFHITTAGIIGTGVGGLTFLAAVQYTGAAIAAALYSAAPLFAVPLSVILLKEEITKLVVAGSILTMGGVWLLL